MKPVISILFNAFHVNNDHFLGKNPNCWSVFTFFTCLFLLVHTKLWICSGLFNAMWSLLDFYRWKNNRFMIDNRSSLTMIDRTQLRGPIPLTKPCCIVNINYSQKVHQHANVYLSGTLSSAKNVANSSNKYCWPLRSGLISSCRSLIFLVGRDSHFANVFKTLCNIPGNLLKWTWKDSYMKQIFNCLTKILRQITK